MTKSCQIAPALKSKTPTPLLTLTNVYIEISFQCSYQCHRNYTQRNHKIDFVHDVCCKVVLCFLQVTPDRQTWKLFDVITGLYGISVKITALVNGTVARTYTSARQNIVSQMGALCKSEICLCAHSKYCQKSRESNLME